MAVKIRLARGGTKKRPHYSIVAADSRMARDKGWIEKLGTYNPMLPKDAPGRVVLNTERIQHWLKVGAQPTDRTALMLSQAGLVAAPKRTEKPQKSAPKKKAQERMAEEAAMVEKAAEKAREAEASAKAAAEAEEAAKAAAAAPSSAEASAKADAPAEETAAEAPAEATAEETSEESAA